MKPLTKITNLLKLSALTLALVATPTITQAKEQQKGESRHVVVNGSKNHGHSNNHKSTGRSHKGSSHKGKSHRGSKHKYKHHNKHSYKHHSHKRRHRGHNIAKAIIAGAAIHATFGRHGSHYNGHAWCPTHSLYHTHRHHYSYGHTYYNYDYNRSYKVDSYIELDDGLCFKVTEYSNGDERKKRIRDHHCADLVEYEEWDEWDEPE